MGAIFVFGFLLGLQHALEADHLAAVASISRPGTSPIRAAVRGCVWGLGHGLALTVLVSAVVLSGLVISAQAARGLEFVVGAMLVFLGFRAVLLAWRNRVHIHFHRHGGGRFHIHAHRHAAGGDMANHNHAHHSPSATFLAMAVGAVHGLAGSAALVILIAAASLNSYSQVLVYVVLFGFGAALGMAVLSFTLSMTLRRVQDVMPSWSNAGIALIGAITIGLGLHVMFANSV